MGFLQNVSIEELTLEPALCAADREYIKHKLDSCILFHSALCIIQLCVWFITVEIHVYIDANDFLVDFPVDFLAFFVCCL